MQSAENFHPICNLFSFSIHTFREEKKKIDVFFISLSIGYEKADAGFVSRLSRLGSELRCENYWMK